MRIVRTLGPVLAFTIVSSQLLWSPMARGQESPVSMTLRSQTPFTTLDEPAVTFVLGAQNLGEEPLGDLSVVLSIGPAIRSRVGYEASLVDGPGATLIHLETFTRPGTIEAGETRELRAKVDLSDLDGVSVADSAVYPAQVELRTGGISVAWVDTPLVHLVRTPDVPIDLAWWIEVDAPIAMDPEGLLAEPALEEAIGPEGGLSQQVDAVRAAVTRDDDHVAVDLVIVPALIDQLARMADGYQRVSGEQVAPGERPATDAEALLDELRLVVADDDVHVVAPPFSAPLLPSLASGGLGSDLGRQDDLGTSILADVLRYGRTGPTARPPQGALDDASLQWLADAGATTVLAQADTVERPVQPNDFALLPTATVTTEAGSSLDLVLPDPGVQTLLGDPVLSSDPVRASQAVLGELATIWREQPVPGPQLDGSETVRGVAVSLPASLPAAIWAPLVRRLSRAPFLRTTDAATFVDRMNPVQDDAVIAQSLGRFPRDYLEAIRDQRRNVAAYRSMLVGPSAQPGRLERNLLYAEAGQYVSDPVSGRRWYDQVNDETNAVFQSVLPDVEQEFLLTSSEGTIPLRMGDPGSSPLTVQVVLRSASFEFPDGAEQTVVLERPNEIVTFDVVAKASGPQTIKVKVRAPSGRDLGEDQNLTVRTTAVNSLALWTTIGAGVVLVLLWSRRLVRRPKP